MKKALYKFYSKVDEIIHGLKSADKGTIIRTILQILAYVNQVIALIGKTSFASEAWYQWLSLGCTFVITALTWWENNDVTAAAQWGTKVLDALQDGKIDEEEVKKLLGGDDK